MSEPTSIFSKREACEHFAELYVGELSKELIRWNDTAIRPTGGRLDELIELVKEWAPDAHYLPIAQRLAERAALDFAAKTAYR